MTGHDVDAFWARHGAGALGEQHAPMEVDREQGHIVTGVAVYHILPHCLSSIEFPDDDALLERIDRMVGQLEKAAGHRIDRTHPTHQTPRPDGASYHALHKDAVTWGPGEPQLVALHRQRDPATKTFCFAHVTLPLPAIAQSWLVHRGCPPKEISLAPGMGTAPADETTRALEHRLMSDGDHFALLHSYTDDDPDDAVTVVVLRSLDVGSPSPFRVLHEAVDTGAWIHTLREGGFAIYAEALQWCEDALSGEAPPLPPVQPAVRSAQRPANSLPAPVQHPAGRSR